MHPLKPSWRTELPALALIALAAALAAFLYPRLPAQVPVHWNFAGAVDRYGGKTGATLMGPLMMAGIYILFLVFPYLDPRRERYIQFRRVYFIMRTGFLAFFLLIFTVTGLSGLGYRVPVGTIVPVLVGILFMVIGNYLSKVKTNWFMGIRTPWTLSDPDNWQRTHRFAGKTYVLGGVCMAAVPFLPGIAGVLSLAAAFVSFLSPVVYSYFMFRQRAKPYDDDQQPQA